MRFFRRTGKDRDIPAVVGAERILAKRDYLGELREPISRGSAQILRDFLEGYSLANEEGPEGVCTIIKDKLSTALVSSDYSRIEVSFGNEEFLTLLRIRLSFVPCDKEILLREGFTEDVNKAIGDIVGAFTGTGGSEEVG